MLPQSQARKKKNSSKINLLISFVFHAVLVVALLYFAAREGLLGKQLKKISIEMVKEKQPEKPKAPEKPKVEPPKVEAPKAAPEKLVEAPKTLAPAAATQPVIAPPAAELPSFDFEGGKAVETSSDPVQLYKGSVEYALRSKWQRPEDEEDENYVAEVAVTVGKDGQISDPVWKKQSGDKRWDDSVRAALETVRRMDRPPPTNFPPNVLVRFDVQEQSESLSP